MPVGKLLGQQAPRPPKWRAAWRALLQWRDWSLPAKLAAVTLVPMLIAVVLGATTIAGQVDRADGYQRTERLVALNGGLRAVLDGVQRERTQTVNLLDQGQGGSDALTVTRGEVDKAIPAMTEAAGRAVELDGGLAAAERAAADRLAELPAIRERVAAGQLDPVQAVDAYSAITGALLALDTAVTAQASDGSIGGTPSALHALLTATEQVSIEQALVGYGITRGGLTPSELNRVRSAELRLEDRLATFRAAATPQQRELFDATVTGSQPQARQDMVGRLLGDGSGDSGALGQLSAQQWQDAAGTVAGQLRTVSAGLGGEITSAAADLVESAGNNAGILAVLLFSAFVLAAAVVFVISRQLLRTLRVLRVGALDVADNQLPAAVHNIQEGRPQSTEVQPVPVRSADEIGQVARAFDAVHSQALRLAVAQAAMRTGYSNVFVNLSRRSQSLVQRQLQLIERLERDEEDADQLATLFQLDHLATRMRRNNENLMVLSGAEAGRRSGQPVSTTDVLRAAVSEIEQYQRVVVRTPPASRVLGYAASDLMRLIAELLDNATAFSAPDTQVIVVTQLADDGSLSVDIIDKGIGMNEAEVAEANARMTESASVDLATSRRMGLFVVGRLASRHRVGVVLHGGKDIVGVRATVTVPPALVAPAGQDGPAPAPERAEPAQPEAAAPLPRRQRTVNGSPIERGLAGLDPQGAPANGVASAPPPRTAGPPSDLEISGTALFSPIGSEEQPEQRKPRPQPAPQAQPPAPRPQPAEPAQPDQAAQPAEQAAPEEPEPAGEQADTGAEPGTPARRPAVPGGRELFEANSTVVSDWWSAATTAADAARRAQQTDNWRTETTPIFDATLSAWFRTAEPEDDKPKAGAAKPEASAASASAAPAASTSGAAAPAAANWDFASDESMRTVQALSRSEPSSYTQAGLPRRRRGEYLMPGSAAAETAEAGSAETRQEPPARDPGNVRSRLSSFQQGVSRGRRQSQAEPETAAQAPEQAPAAGARQKPLPQRKPRQQRSEPRATSAGGADNGAVPNPPKPPTQPNPPAAPDSAEENWSFASDERQRAAQAAMNSAPSTYTSAGLPRRRRGERLLPGSAGPGDAPARTPREAADVRGRLSSFQQGIRRGRHQAAEQADGNQEKVEGE